MLINRLHLVTMRRIFVALVLMTAILKRALEKLDQII